MSRGTTDRQLAMYKPLAEYKPTYGDHVVWSGWITTWHGIVSNYDRDTDELYIIFAGVPFLLLTMDANAQAKETRKINLTKIKNASQGNWAIHQHDYQRNATVWYI